VGYAETQDEAAAAQEVKVERGEGQHHRTMSEGQHHAGAQFDLFHCRRHGGKRQQG